MNKPVIKPDNKYFDIYAPVFYPAAGIAFLFIITTLVVGEPIAGLFNEFQSTISLNFGWFLVICINVLLIVSLYFGLGRFGKIKLGGPNARPDFSRFSWLSMLFSAGMGIGLLFFSVAEPMLHFSQPPYGDAKTEAAARLGTEIAFFHYGIHVWGIYCIVGLALAFFAFNKGLPLTIRSAFYPLLGDKIYGPIGSIIDVVAVVATLCGLATTLGFGAQQVASGFKFLFGFSNDVTAQVIIIALITAAATTSVVLGLDKGIRVLSLLNVRIAALLLLLFIFIGPTLYLFKSFFINTGSYLLHLPSLATFNGAYTEQGDFFRGWSIFTWAWWFSWAPFVGMFIAQISRGRTVREFVLGVLLVPSILTYLWMGLFSASAFYLQFEGIADISAAVDDNISTALFVVLENYPLATFTSLLGITLVVSFFVTSSDSGSLVIDNITSGGKLNAPVGQRIFWATTEGAVAATLLIGGGLSALQAASISTGFPFAFLLLIMCYCLYKGMKTYLDEPKEKHQPD